MQSQNLEDPKAFQNEMTQNLHTHLNLKRKRTKPLSITWCNSGEFFSKKHMELKTRWMSN